MSLTDMDICVAFGKLRRNVAFSVKYASMKHREKSEESRYPSKIASNDRTASMSTDIIE